MFNLHSIVDQTRAIGSLHDFRQDGQRFRLFAGAERLIHTSISAKRSHIMCRPGSLKWLIHVPGRVMGYNGHDYAPFQTLWLDIQG